MSQPAHAHRYMCRGMQHSLPCPSRMPTSCPCHGPCGSAAQRYSAAFMAKGAVRAQCGDRRAATECRASPRWAAPRRVVGHPAGGWDCSGVAGWPAWRLHRPHRSHRTWGIPAVDGGTRGGIPIACRARTSRDRSELPEEYRLALFACLQLWSPPDRFVVDRRPALLKTPN